jgi:hypothetical protein
MKKILLLVLMLIESVTVINAGEENDLWLLLSTYEDIGITVNDLAFFLATHGYNAEPQNTYVTIKFSSGKEVYLTPNGAAPRLADLWMSPPTEKSGPIMVLPQDAVKANISLKITDDKEFIKKISRVTIFPVTPLGMCYDGSLQLEGMYKSFGYSIIYLYDPSSYDQQGHLWIAIENPSYAGTWLAVDSYYGVMETEDYYIAPYGFKDFKYLDSINPKWKVA